MSDNLPALPERRFTIAEIGEVSEAIAASGLFGIKTRAQAFALGLIADAEGLHPASVAQDYDVIQGRPARKTHSVLARFQQAGGTVEWQDFTEQRVSAKFSHPRGGAVVVEWTIEMAKRARLSEKDNWKMYPRAMLRARCIGEGVRAVYPAALGGALLVEEAKDLEPLTVDADTGAITGGAAPTVGRKPKAAPKPAADVIDVEPQAVEPHPALEEEPAQPGNVPMAGEGEINFLHKKAKSEGVDLPALLAQLGGLVAEVGKLSKPDFERVREALRTKG